MNFFDFLELVGDGLDKTVKDKFEALYRDNFWMRGRSDWEYLFLVLCPNCGCVGPHFGPPSFGDRTRDVVCDNCGERHGVYRSVYLKKLAELARISNYGFRGCGNEDSG